MESNPRNSLLNRLKCWLYELIMDWLKDFYVYSLYKARNCFSKRLHGGDLNLYFVHGFKKPTCTRNATLGTTCTSTVGPACNIKSHKNGVVILTYFSRWKYQFVSCFCLVIRVRCEERAELTSWLTLQLGLHCLPCVHPKTRNYSPLTFDRVVWDICSDNTQNSLRIWRSCCSDCYAQLKWTKTPQGWKNFPPKYTLLTSCYSPAQKN